MSEGADKINGLERAAEVLREYAALIEESGRYRSGPLKGRCDPEIEEEIAEYRALAACIGRVASQAPHVPEGHVLVPIATLEKWGDAIEPYRSDGSYNNNGVIDTIAEMATYVTKGHGHGKARR